MKENIENKPLLEDFKEKVHVMAQVAIKVGSSTLLLIILNSAINQGSRSVSANADTPTPAATRTLEPTRTPTATLTSTPTVPSIWLTVTAEAGKLKQDRDTANAQATLTAIAQERKVLQEGTPTPRPPEATATPGPKINEIVVGMETVVAGRMNEKAIATAKADLTATVVARPAATAQARETAVAAATASAGASRGTRNGESGGIPGIVWLMGAFVGGSLAFARRQQIKDLFTHMGAPNWRVVNFVRTHGGDRVVLSGPVQYVWRQIGRALGI